MCMSPTKKTHVFFYNESIIQMGFIAFFAVSFPLAPIFSFGTNILNVQFKLKLMSKYWRRDVAVCSDGIGNWTSIIEFLSFMAVPINLSILLFARRPGESEPGWNQDLDKVPIEKQSEVTQYLMSQGDGIWNRYNILLLAIIIEHLLIAFKDAIALMIPDVPLKVQKSEKNRHILKRRAIEEINKLTNGISKSGRSAQAVSDQSEQDSGDG